MNRWILRALAASALALSLAGPAVAQEAEKPAAAAAGELAPEQIREFKAERLEELRYSHLWIAYGGIWLLVFGFAFRTWRQSRKTGDELADLKRRLLDLEAKNG